MKHILILMSVIVVIYLPKSVAQTNNLSVNGDVEIHAGRLLIQTTVPRNALLTFQDVRYSPHQVYNFLTQSDGLQIRQDNVLNYQFKTGGDFIVNNGRIGIGTYSPMGKLHIDKVSGSSESLLTLRDLRYSPNIVYNFVTESDGLQIRQDNTINYQFKAGGNFIVNNGSVGIGTSYLSQEAKLTVAGRIYAQEVKVSLSAGIGPDFVFEKSYDLMTLDELKKFITTNKHLPGIEPAKEMEEKGIDLGKMDMRLLQKIEELTLYLIDFQNQINLLKEENHRLNNLVTELKKQH
jgi:hypothetical protein